MSATPSAGSDSQDGGSAYVGVKIEPDPGFTLQLEQMTATETLGRPFLCELTLSSTQAKGDLHTLLGTSVTISTTGADKTTKRYFNGIVARVAYAGLAGSSYRYLIELRPSVWLLSRAQDCRIYQTQTVWAIITAVLQDGNVTVQDKRNNQTGDLQLDYCVQYRETTLDFITRLMETYGLYYYFTHTDGAHTLVLADDPNSHTALTATIPYSPDRTEYRGVDAHIWDWSSDLHLQPGGYTMRDYNFTTPSADLTARSQNTGQHPHDALEVYDYPGVYDDATNGQKLTDVRIQDLAARRQVLHGMSNARGLHTGCKFTLGQASDSGQNAEYLVIASTWSFSAAETMSDTRGELTDTFRCDFQAIPGATPFRLDRQVPWPLVRGPQTAKVVGESGQEITTDQYGRIKVKFHWDRSDAQDETASCWVRVAQVWAGAGWGGMFIPRIGQEVVISFLEGNPDRPLVTGCVYNATQTVPYALPDKKNQSTLRTSSTTGNSGNNEMRFDDTAGSEEVFFQAQKDFTKKVLHSETITITQDTTTTVQQGKRSITVSQGDDEHIVSTGKRSVTVSQGADELTVSAGNHSIEVSAGASKLDAAQSITLSVGGNSIKIDTSGVTITTTGPINLQAGGALQAQSGAAMSLTGGASMSLTAPTISIN